MIIDFRVEIYKVDEFEKLLDKWNELFIDFHKDFTLKKIRDNELFREYKLSFLEEDPKRIFEMGRDVQNIVNLAEHAHKIKEERRMDKEEEIKRIEADDWKYTCSIVIQKYEYESLKKDLRLWYDTIKIRKSRVIGDSLFVTLGFNNLMLYSYMLINFGRDCEVLYRKNNEA